MRPTILSLAPSPLATAQRALQALPLRLSEALARWQQSRDARATARALQGLDDRVLRDIGLHRSELSSVAAELQGLTERERLLALRSTLLPG